MWELIVMKHSKSVDILIVPLNFFKQFDCIPRKFECFDSYDSS